LTLIDDAVVGAVNTGDIGIYTNLGNGDIKVIGCKSTGGKGSISVNTYAKAFISDNIFLDGGWSPIIVNATNWFEVIGNRIEDFLLRGIYSYGTPTYGIFTNNRISCKNDSDAIATNYYGIDHTGGNNINIIGNIIKMVTARTGGIPVPIFLSTLTEYVCNFNAIVVDVSSSANAFGAYLTACNDGEFSNNSVKMDNNDKTGTHYCIFTNNSPRNIIQGNNLNAVNNDAKDIGIQLNGTSDNNQGGDNITYNVGTSIVDNGAGNAVTAKDV